MYRHVCITVYYVSTVETDTLASPLYVLITEVLSIQRSFHILQYYTRTQDGVLNLEVLIPLYYIRI